MNTRPPAEDAVSGLLDELRQFAFGDGDEDGLGPESEGDFDFGRDSAGTGAGSAGAGAGGLYAHVDFATGGRGDSQAFDAVGGVDFQDALLRARDADSQPGEAQESDLPGSASGAGRGSKKKAHTEFIVAEDFEEGPPRDAFLLIEEFARQLFLERSTAKKRANAIRFFYVRTLHEIHFADCCAAIDPSIRPGVILLRMNYELWKRWIVFGAPLPEEADQAPTEATLRAANFADEEGVILAQEAWYQPGITTDELLRRAKSLIPGFRHSQVESALTLLAERHVLSTAAPDHWYLTGRNPALEAEERQQEARRSGVSLNLSTPSWSSMF